MLSDKYIQKLYCKAKVKHPELAITERTERPNYEESELIYHVKLEDKVNRSFNEDGINAFLFGLTL